MRSMRKVVFFLPLVVVLGLGILFWNGFSLDTQERPSALTGKPVPNFELPWVERPGEYLNQEVFKGQISLLNVWGTWCPACLDEHSFLMALADRGVRIIGLDYKDDLSAARKWLRDLGNPYQATIFDQHGSLGLDLGVYGAPETFLIDQYGIVRLRHVGVVNESVWQEKFLPLIKQYSEGEPG